jgi:acetylornithine/N-succinyldiaminopimelate aminotransferase
MFRHASIALRFNTRLRLGGAPELVDTYRRAHRMPATCRPEKAARFVFRDRSRCDRANARIATGPNFSVIIMTKSATSHLLPVFARVDLGFERGEGAWLVASDGERYLDFTSGVAVNALGHCHPHLVAALQQQATKLWHMSNLFKSPDGERLAARLCEQSFAGFVFFANSGAEAVECAIKLTRKYQAANGHPERYRIITFDGAFHGRTLATLAATGSPKYLEGFGPPVDGFDQVALGDLDAVKKAIGPETAGIMIEPLQGEGGVRAAPHAFFRALRQLCDDKGLLLVFDEVQTGMGRTGELFAYKRLGVTPDVMSLAKALGGGFPIGACLATTEAAIGMTPGSHGSTFGGNPLAIAAANAVLDVMLKPGFFEHVQRMSLLFKQKLASVIDRHPDVLAEVRGEGLLIGVKAVVPSADLVTALREQKLLTVGAGENVVRLLPPLIVTEAEIEESVSRLERACVALSGGQLKRAAGQ